MWCARVAICQHRLEWLPVRLNNASMDRVIDLLNSTFIRSFTRNIESSEWITP